MAERILTTHVGSLPRSKAVTDLVFAQERGEAVDPATFDQVIGAAVDDAVARQVASGVDLVSDGEMSKISYATYIKDRITGFDGDSARTPPKDLEMFPNFMARQDKGGGTPTYRGRIKAAAPRLIAAPNASARSRPKRSRHCTKMWRICRQRWRSIRRLAAS